MEDHQSLALSSFVNMPDLEVVKKRFIGQPIDLLSTPAVLIDRSKVEGNIAKMQKTVTDWDCLFRAHIKTHKTREGTVLQLAHSSNRSIIVSTLAEAWGIVKSGLIEEGTVDDILYGIPIGINKIPEILLLRASIQSKSKSADLKVLVDNIVQVKELQKSLLEPQASPLSVFIKIDSGYHRAGLTVSSHTFVELIREIKQSDRVAIWGVYCHAGNSYGSTTLSKASSFLTEELQCTNEAAKIVYNILEEDAEEIQRHRKPLVLSVGSTPTAHAASTAPTDNVLRQLKSELHGELELHAGNYPFLDLQQVATGAISIEDGESWAVERCAMTVLASVLSIYPGRGAAESNDEKDKQLSSSTEAHPSDEALCDAGSIALSKDTGQLAGFGHIISPRQFIGWQVGRIAQEHGVLTIRPGGNSQWSREWGASPSSEASLPMPSMVNVGDKVQIVPQHACMVASAHPWFYVYDSSRKVQAGHMPVVEEIWAPWKGW